ncbi:MAG TPA: TolC family protein [Candidatus Sulfobium mesophilum]|nr:TolC family protein [Candidatus Sulfobium mesophilum]
MDMRFIKVRAAVLLLIAAYAVSALAEERKLTLEEVLVLAQTGNPEIRALHKSVLGVAEDIGIARSFTLPRISFEERFMRTNNPTYSFMAKLNQSRFEEADFAVESLNHPPAINDFQSSFSVEQPVFVPKAHIAIDMAKKESTAKGEEFDRKREEVAFRVIKTYLGVQTAKAFVAVSTRGVDDAKEHLRIATARNNAETGLYSDMLRAGVALSSAEEKLVTAQKNLEVAKRALGLTIGLSESVEVYAERPRFEVKTIDYYYASALSRKDVKSLEIRYKNAENSLKMANAGYWPVIGVGGSYQLNSNHNPLGDEGSSWLISAFLRWELFDGARREHEKEKAKHLIDETAEYLDGMKKKVSFEVYEAFLGVQEARKSLDLANAALGSAEESSRLVKARYENSLSAIVDLLDVQTSVDAARANVINREGAYLTAIANLEFQSGTIMKDLSFQK